MASEAKPLRHFPGVPASGAQILPLVLLAGFGEAETAELRSLLEDDCRVATARLLSEARTALQGKEVAVLCFGRLLSPLEARALLDDPAGNHPLVLLTAAGPQPELFQDLIDEDRLFYLSQGELPPRELSELVLSALARRRSIAEEPAPAGLRQVLQVARRVAVQPDLASAGELLQLAMEEAVEADRTYCLLHDPAREVLWSRNTGLEGEERHESSAVGLVSFVAHTGRPVRVERATEDPRYEREADDPLGGSCEHLLAVPVRALDENRVLAVLCSVRDPGRPPFSPSDEAAMELLAATVAPPLAQLDLEARLDGEGRLLDRELHERAAEVFREEAVEYHVTMGSREGDWLRLSPRWTNSTFWLLVALVVAFLTYSLVGTIDEYATGPAVVRLSGRTEVTANQEGIVTAVEVRPGDRVAAGQPLVRFQSARETAELQRIEREWDLQLIEHLRDLSAPGPSQVLIGLQAERDLARSRVEERVVRAPRAGLVRDVRSRPNQHVGSGDILLSLTGAVSSASLPVLMAVLPGEHRPLLRARMPLILELRGYGHAPQRLAITAVAEEVVDPEEARRLLGPEVATAVPLTGPVVLVEARFPDVAFEADGKRYELHDGMWGKAEVRVRSEPLLAALVPGLRTVMERLRG
ncbi:MAG TPA: GAF domain-containing protein [Thermoanaerobaculia bacterium]|jgi:membrane fusion protein (multidrug efflux system)|nr:GAF domain-containing protein [Thermoanaerobaculia bacterium]